MQMEGINRFRPWFYAATVYNFVWGTIVVLFPNLYFDLVGLLQPNYPALWQSVGMMVQVYAIGYWLIARDPVRYAPLVWVGLAGKTFGPLGFLWAATHGEIPWQFGYTLLLNDLIWWPAFWIFALRYARGKQYFK
jgi:hypothetical protein